MVVLGRSAVSYERGTAVALAVVERIRGTSDSQGQVMALAGAVSRQKLLKLSRLRLFHSAASLRERIRNKGRSQRQITALAGAIFQAKVVKCFEVVPFSPGSGLTPRAVQRRLVLLPHRKSL